MMSEKKRFVKITFKILYNIKSKVFSGIRRCGVLGP